MDAHEDVSRTSDLVSVDARPRDAVSIIRVRGEVDLTAASEFSDALRSVWQRATGTVVVDLCEVTFMDSSGLHALLNAQRRLTRAGRRFLLVCPDGPVLRVMGASGLMETFALFQRLEDALAA